MVWLSSLLWSAGIDIPASSLVFYRLPPVLTRFPVPSRAIRSTFSSRSYHFPVSSSAVRPMIPQRPCYFPASSCAVRPTLPFVRPVFRRVVRDSFGVSSRPSHLPFCPVSRLQRSHLFLSFAGYYCTRRTTLLFGGLLGKPSH